MDASVTSLVPRRSKANPVAGGIPGALTGRFRTGRNQLLVNEDGKRRISMEDYAIAFVDEPDNPRHRRRRFTAGH